MFFFFTHFFFPSSFMFQLEEILGDTFDDTSSTPDLSSSVKFGNVNTNFARKKEISKFFHQDLRVTLCFLFAFYYRINSQPSFTFSWHGSSSTGWKHSAKSHPLSGSFYKIKRNNIEKRTTPPIHFFTILQSFIFTPSLWHCVKNHFILTFAPLAKSFFLHCWKLLGLFFLLSLWYIHSNFTLVSTFLRFQTHLSVPLPGGLLLPRRRKHRNNVKEWSATHEALLKWLKSFGV